MKAAYHGGSVFEPFADAEWNSEKPMHYGVHRSKSEWYKHTEVCHRGVNSSLEVSQTVC